MNIIWHYLDKRGATVNALKDYGSMQYIIDHTDEEIASVHDRITSVGGPVLSDMPPGQRNPQAPENRIIAAIDEIDVLKERYRQAVEYMAWFRPAWEELSEEERLLLSEYYWNEDERQVDAIYYLCEHFAIERSSVYKKKNRALNKLTLLLFGK